MKNFFVLEGIDGCGKDTILKELKKHFIQQNKSLKTTQFTYEPTKNNDYGKKIYHLLKTKQLFSFSKKEIFEFYLQDRFFHTQEIKKLLLEGKTVFSSRYDLSSYAYQKEEDKNFEQEYQFFYQKHHYQKIEENNEKKNNETEKKKEQFTFIPTITFFLNITAEQSLERLQKRKFLDEFETLKQLKRIEKNYLTAINFLKKKDDRKIVLLDATLKPEKITQEIIQYILKIN